MKKCFAFLVITLIANCATSQILVDTNKVWSTLSCVIVPEQECSSSWIKFTDDTLINNIEYKKVLRSDEEFQLYWYSYGFIREDSTKSVYWKMILNSDDRFLYDFNVDLGDTIYCSYIGFAIVDSIDSVQISNELKKRYFLRHGYDLIEEIWIEGLGSLYGILTSFSGSGGGMRHELLCFIENDTIKYTHPDYNTCYYSTVGITQKEGGNETINLFPNPSNDFINIDIENSSNKTFQLIIINIFGNTITDIPFKNSQTIDLRKYKMSNGIYFYFIFSNNKLLKKGKIFISK